MDTFQIVRNATGKFDVVRGTEKVETDLTHAEANRRIIAIQNKQIYEDVLRRIVRREFLRATEDMEMDSERVLKILRGELDVIEAEAVAESFKRHRFVPTIHSFAVND